MPKINKPRIPKMLIEYKGLKIFSFSDTHGMHQQLEIPENVDVLICAGDAVEDNLDPNDYLDFLNWFSAQPATYRIYVPGNHELIFDIAPEWGAMLLNTYNIEPALNTTLNIENENQVVSLYLYSGCSRTVEDNINNTNNVDFLITHYPPEMIFGFETIQARYHIFGHEHETNGMPCTTNGTMQINVSKYNQLKKVTQ